MSVSPNVIKIDLNEFKLKMIFLLNYRVLWVPMLFVFTASFSYFRYNCSSNHRYDLLIDDCDTPLLKPRANSLLSLICKHRRVGSFRL